MTAEVGLWTGEETVVPAGLRGYRSWNLSGTKLCSTGVQHECKAPEVDARCLSAEFIGGLGEQDCPCDLCVRGRHPAPVKDCTCGIYGWYSPDDTRLVRGHVFGVVEATGRVVLASHGFRAQAARIVALAIEPVRPTSAFTISIAFGPEPPTRDELHDLARWAKAQGIPVFASRAELLAEYPPEDVSSLVEHECDETCQANTGHEYRAFTHSFSLSSGITSTYPTVTLEQARPSRWWFAYKAFFLLIAVIGCVFGLIALSPTALLINGALAGYWAHDLWPYRPDLLRRSKAADAANDEDDEDES